MRVGLLVLYSERVEACRDFYTFLGLDLLREQHGGGPVHYAAELPDGLVLEIYPDSPGRSTGRLRLGLVVPATAQLPEGEHKMTDPDGRVVVVNAMRGALRFGVAGAAGASGPEAGASEPLGVGVAGPATAEAAP